MIEMKPVKSSHIAEMGHDGQTLAIKYNSGATYHYDGVSAQKYKDLICRQSIGKAWAAMRASYPGKLIK